MRDRVIVLGAGLAGLSASYHLGGVDVYEREPHVGGHASTRREKGFNFDEGAHVFFGSDDVSREFVWDPLGAEMERRTAEIWNNYGGTAVGRYPVQANAHALAPDVATRCVMGFIEANASPEREVRTYEEWCHASFGGAFAEEFMLRYARKIWTVEPSELTTEWLGSKVGGRISRPSLEQVIQGAIDPSPNTLNYLTEFAYPRDRGFGRIAESLAERIPAVRTECGVTTIESTVRQITFDDGSSRSYDAAISTIPLPELVKRVTDAPESVRQAADALLCTSIRCVNLGVDRVDVGPGHWVYFYDHDIPFFRVSFPSKFASGNAPDGCGSISCEISYSRRKPLDEHNLVARVVDALRSTGVLRASDQIVYEAQLDIPYAYVVFDFARESALKTIHAWMESVGLFPCGRFGEWGYHWSFEAIESGRRVAATVAARLGLPAVTGR